MSQVGETILRMTSPVQLDGSLEVRSYECSRFCGGSHATAEEEAVCTEKHNQSSQQVIRKESGRPISAPQSETPAPSFKKKPMTQKEKWEAANWRRANPTESEAHLAEALKQIESLGFEVKREYRIQGYYADFCIPLAKLVIEVDGPVHEGTIPYDARRDGILGMDDWRVLRFTSKEVMRNVSEVIRRVEKFLESVEVRIRKTKPSPQSICEKPDGDISRWVVTVVDGQLIATPPGAQPSSSRNQDLPRVEKGKFVCLRCPERNPFIAPLGSPRCYGCGKNDETRLVCTRCGETFQFNTIDPSRRCPECRDFGDVAREAAKGMRSDMTPIRELNGGCILKSDS
jgi:very-short-patch-repair endonuclease